MNATHILIKETKRSLVACGALCVSLGNNCNGFLFERVLGACHTTYMDDVFYNSTPTIQERGFSLYAKNSKYSNAITITLVYIYKISFLKYNLCKFNIVGHGLNIR